MGGLAAKLRSFSRGAAGRVVRAPLKLVPGEWAMPILWGRLRGKRWVVGSSFQSCWFGVYEYEKQQLFIEAIRSGDVIYDVGANVGFYTLLASHLTGPAGRVIAFEPLPRNLGYLRRHVEANRLRNVTVVDGAVSDKSGTAHFALGDVPEMSHLVEAGGIEVRTYQLDELVETGTYPPPQLLKIDVEGAEADVIRGATRLLTDHRPLILLATHGDAVHKECWGLLESHGYDVELLDDGGGGPYREVRARPRAAR